ncbi:uncharacterized protein LOC128556490 [Mercenaria mercenaria]|uniref:uncharacterized protein LOC128556490 n=1 Tax=Mercenaria mercenaria TaxID=6596 RepID=UPI00234E4954|nr:uncharacterized protein LOC128556490 [Mercenaria mercenaria]
MFLWIYVWFYFTITLTSVFVGAQFATETCVEASHTQKSSRLDCTDGYISDVTVKSGMGKCKQTGGGCLGMTPALMVNSMNCYWHNTCLINWPQDPIVFTEPDVTDRTCLGMEPAFMRIRYNCFKPTDHQEDYGYVKLSGNDVQPKRLLIDMCSDLKDGKSVYTRNGDSHMAGIIRSHKLHPWNYSNQPRKCSVKIYWPTGQRLVVTIQNIDLSEDDQLIIGNRGRVPVNVSSSETFSFSNGSITTIVFNVGEESNSGKGFILCFKFISDEDQGIKNACESIMTNGMITNLKPDMDDPDPLSPHQDKMTTSTITTPAIITPAVNNPSIPKRCLQKKTEKARLRCAKRRNGKGRNGKKKKQGKRNKRKKDKKRSRKKTT